MLAGGYRKKYLRAISRLIALDARCVLHAARDRTGSGVAKHDVYTRAPSCNTTRNTADTPRRNLVGPTLAAYPRLASTPDVLVQP